MIIVSVSITNFINDEVSRDMESNPKAQALVKEWNVQANNLLELCTTSDPSNDTFPSLQNCKTVIQSLRNDCNEKFYSKTDLCVNTDFTEFDKEIDERLTIVEAKIEALNTKISTLKKQLEITQPSTTTSDVFEDANQKMLTYFDVCVADNDEKSRKDCSETAKKMISVCANTSVSACNDPRLEEIANWNSNQDSTQQNLDAKIGYLPHSRSECIPDRVCFVQGDYLMYNGYLNGELFSIENYTYGGTYDVDQVWVNIDFIQVQENGNFPQPQTGQPIDPRYGLVLTNIEILQPSPVKIEKWTRDSPSAETLKDKVVESSYDFNGFKRKAIVVNVQSPSNIIDKETGILLFHQDNWFGSPSSMKLVRTNIIQSSNFP